MQDKDFIKKITEIVNDLQESGYEPYGQLTAYADLGNELYITRHNNAREKIKGLDRGQISNYLKEQGWWLNAKTIQSSEENE